MTLFISLLWNDTFVLGRTVIGISVAVVLAFSSNGLILAGEAPCPPGQPSTWAPAAKEFLGTAVNRASRVWFTGAEGILTEVLYPTVDRVQNVDLQLLVGDAKHTWLDEERRQRRREVHRIHRRAMLWQVVTTADSVKWRITKTVFSDPGRNSVIIRVLFTTLEPGKSAADYCVYLLNNPAINSTGSGGDLRCGSNPSSGPDDSCTRTIGPRTMLVASEPRSTGSALAVSLPWKVVGGNTMVSNGFVGVNDGYADLLAGGSDRLMDWHFEGAHGGNVAQMGWLDTAACSKPDVAFDVVLAFGATESEATATAQGTLGSDLDCLQTSYVNEWIRYTDGLDPQEGTADDQYYLAAMTLKTVQDKSNGAMVAGLGTPWGESCGDSNPGGYHLVWARDLFKFAGALIAAGDEDSANRAADYLFNVQMQTVNNDNPRSRVGRFPQNTYVDGRVYWNETQMDEASLPIVLAWRLKRTDLWPKVKLAADFVAKNGPRTEQDRWEEMGGYSPSTMAAEIAGLVCAADLARMAGDNASMQRYLTTADCWRNNVVNWTFTTNGFHGNGKHFVRITADRNPNTGAILAYENGAGTHDQRLIVDGGFLELVRMGVMSPNDWTILETLPEYDSVLRQTIPNVGDFWFRYNYDGYGEYDNGRSFDGSGRGRLWPIFTAERGVYEIARTGNGAKGTPFLAALRACSAPSGFIPEQVWNTSASITGWQTLTPAGNRPGTATRSVRPLSWAMGEYINLAVAVRHGHSDAPAVVSERYASDKPQTVVTFNVTAPTVWGESVFLVGNHPLLGRWIPASGIQLSPASYPNWTVSVSLPSETAFEYAFVKLGGKDGATWEKRSRRVFTTPRVLAVRLTGAFGR